jgi:hypothetical protein
MVKKLVADSNPGESKSFEKNMGVDEECRQWYKGGLVGGV